MPDSFDDAAAQVAWLPDFVYTNGRFESGTALICGEGGRIIGLAPEGETSAARVVRLKNKAALPGLVNAHSHAFQRVIRGRTERRTTGKDSFWTWRELMYSAATRLAPEEIYDASRMAFLEMALAGITSVGEFHYLHRAPDGSAYDDPNLLSKEVIRAARDTGLRICLLRVAYARSGYNTPPNERQKRFIEPEVDAYLRNVEDLRKDLAAGSSAVPSAWAGLAPHSVRAVPREYLLEVARFTEGKGGVPLHMHVAEQPAEVRACLEEHGRTPVEFLDDIGLLNQNFTGVHAIHITQEETRALARAGANVCACPTTERNLGDGIVPAEMLFAENVPISLGTDSHAQIDLLEDARELEYHLRLQKLERAVLAPEDDASTSALARRLFASATSSGARSINSPGGELQTGSPADFFTVDLNDPSIAGASSDDLLSAVVFNLSRTAIRDVFVGGKQIVSEGRHAGEGETVERFAALQRKLWS
ncbi:MAG TPA: formimidoylglutamate deiminase [Pyrinomonadaceae bacterium]|nr:formimidoylglutamate deiminase [Pyrinomonadaceae bacterium]